MSISDGRIITGATSTPIQAIRPSTIRTVIRSRISLTGTHIPGRIPLIDITSLDTAPVIAIIDFASGCDSDNSLLDQRRF